MFLYKFPNKVTNGIGLKKKNQPKISLVPTHGYWQQNSRYRQCCQEFEHDLFVIGSETQLAAWNVKLPHNVLNMFN